MWIWRFLQQEHGSGKFWKSTEKIKEIQKQNAQFNRFETKIVKLK